MYQNSTVGVVVPAYNEEGFVGDVLRAIPAYVDRIYAIDDCSTDDTWSEIVEAVSDERDRSRSDRSVRLQNRPLGDLSERIDDSTVEQTIIRQFESRVERYEQDGRMIQIDHAENRGAGGAIKTGYLAALVDGVDVIVTIDADGQMDPALMDRLIEPVVDGPVEYAKGTRLIDGDYWYDMPLFRAFGNTALTFLTRIASGYWGMTDSQNGYTAISRSALRQINVGDLFEYYGYCNSVLARLNANNIPIADVEVTTIYGEEESDITYPAYIRKVSLMLLRNFLWRIWKKYDIVDLESPAVMYAISGLCLTAGVVGMLVSLILNTVRSDGPSLRSSAASIVVGGISTALAIFSERLASADLIRIIPFERQNQTQESTSIASQSTKRDSLD